MKASSALLLSKAGLSILYSLIFFAYCLFYAPYGLENNDDGFILGLSHQFFEGATLYDDIIYVRPPASIIFHSISFLYPFEIAPVLSSRFIYFCQIAIYSATLGILFSWFFRFSLIGTFFLAAGSFIFNAHNFPPMAWHTVDGVFFSVIAIYFAATLGNGAVVFRSLLAFIFAYIAALSKQPFYITPLLVMSLMLYPLSAKRAGISLFAALAAAAVIYTILTSMFNVQQMLDAIASQTSFRDLVSAGVLNYARDWYDLRAAATAGPLAVALLIWTYLRVRHQEQSKIRYLPELFVAVIIFYIASMLQMFLATDHWISPKGLIDSVFTITAIISAYETIRTRERAWLALTAMHAISWAASISWGYTTVALFSAPSLIVLAIALRDVFQEWRFTLIGSFAAIFSVAMTFYVGNQFLYSLEGPVRRQDATVSVGAEFPALYGIRTTETQAAALRELAALRSRLGDNIVIAPNWPLYNIIFGGRNPIGVDWLLNTEVGPFEQTAQTRFEQVDYVLVFRNASPRPSSVGKFGSRLTQWVELNWILDNQDERYFDVYKNPSIAKN